MNSFGIDQTAADPVVALERDASSDATAIERHDAEREMLAHAVSHDLSQPLTTISGFADLLARRYGGQLDDDAEEFIQFILKGSRRLQSMLGDLRRYLDVSDREPAPAPVDCRRVLQTAVERLRGDMAATRGTIAVESMPVVRGDAAELATVFTELVSNGLKFTNGGPPRVRISAQRGDGETVFTVNDNGPGIEPAQAERAFELFQRLHTVDAAAGNGVGLAVCKRIVERHGGRIWVDSVPGEGSSFRFTVPDRQPDS